MQNKRNILIPANILVFIIILNLFACKVSQQDDTIYQLHKTMIVDSAIVVSAHPLASKIGLEILKKGGNAIDAAIAVQFALAVCYPGAGNIGGGGFMLYRSKDGHFSALDFREKASASAHTNMYLDSMGNILKDKSLYGHLAAGVPGSVDGMIQAFEKFSLLKDWKALVQPAIDLANNGFAITDIEAKNLNKEQNKFIQYNLAPTAFHKQNWKAGDQLFQKELATTLTAIRDHGRAGFYEGKVADMIVKEMKEGGGIISYKDLMSYHSVWRTPITTTYRGYDVYSIPPPSSGGIALVQMLKMVEPYNLTSLNFQSAAAVHLMVEAERRVYADRAMHLGDSDFYKVPQSKLTDSLYLADRMKDFDSRKASPSATIHAGEIGSEETTHFNVVDRYGNAVAITTTLNGGYGAFTVVRGAGFLLNNEMDDFSVKPDSPNMYGLVGAAANKIEPNKRMLSSMTPTIVEKDGQLKLVVGTPGGSTIITSVFQTILNIIDFGMDANTAVQAPRFHHQWLPDFIQTEKQAIAPKERRILESIGHKIKDRDPIGRVEAVLKMSNGSLQGAADHRGDDDVEGY
jgi:gamma-glutamyltranspeptidase/glutathione hydrolase